MKRLIRILVVALLAGGGGYALWRSFGHRDAESNQLTVYGNVDVRQVDLGFRVSGKLEEMAFDEGDVVKKGDVLGRLDEKPITLEVDLAKAQLAAATAVFEKLQRGSRPQEIAQAEAVVAERETVLNNLEALLSRQEKLAGSGAVSKQALDDAKAQHAEAAARLRSGKESLALATEGPRSEDIAAAQAEKEMAQARLAQAQLRLDDARLVAPADGVILTRVQEPGAIIPTGATVYTLSLRSPVWVRSYVTEPDLGRIHEGMAAEVRTDSRPDQPYQGQVGFISPVAEFTPKSVETARLRTDLVYRLRVIISNPDKALRQGMPVTVTFVEAP